MPDIADTKKQEAGEELPRARCFRSGRATRECLRFGILAITEDLTAQPDNGDEVYEDVLDTQHELYPDKVIIHTEGTIDSVSAEASCNQQCLKPPCGCEDLYAWWQDDAWYWEKEATDWGWDWAQNREVDHPKYAPTTPSSSRIDSLVDASRARLKLAA